MCAKSKDVIHAAARITEEAGELCKEANKIYHYDDVVSRARLHVAAEAVGAMAIRLLTEIGNLKGQG